MVADKDLERTKWWLAWKQGTLKLSLQQINKIPRSVTFVQTTVCYPNFRSSLLSLSTSEEEQACRVYLYAAPQYNGSAVIMRERSTERGEAVTSGPRPLTWNLGKLNPAKGGVTLLSLWRGRVKQRKWVEKQGNTTSQNKMQPNGGKSQCSDKRNHRRHICFSATVAETPEALHNMKMWPKSLVIISCGAHKQQQK